MIIRILKRISLSILTAALLIELAALAIYPFHRDGIRIGTGHLFIWIFPQTWIVVHESSSPIERGPATPAGLQLMYPVTPRAVNPAGPSFPSVRVNGQNSQTTSVAAQAYANARVKWAQSLKSIDFIVPPFGAFWRFPIVAEHDGYIWQEGHQSMLQLPVFWALILGLIPVRVYFLKMRTIRRRRANQCVHCGYDMRATQDRCPECGTVPVKN